MFLIALAAANCQVESQVLPAAAVLPWDGTLPQPGGWNRFALEVTDLDQLVGELRAAGAHFRNEIVDGVGGRQILVDDPSGNAVELFEPSRPEARLEPP
jgi:hypothetical protein